MNLHVSHPPVRHMLAGPTMGTRWSAIFYATGPVDLTAIEAELQNAVNRVDDQMSPWKPDSVLSRFNRADSGTWFDLPDETFEVLIAAFELSAETAGAFDPFMGQLVDLWGFGAERSAPDAAGIGEAEAAWTRMQRQIEFNKDARLMRRLSPARLDLCGIAKGYGVDRLSEVLTGFGLTNHLVTIDGELRASGSSSNAEGWTIALEQPDTDARMPARLMQISDMAIATSGNYRHQRILDDRTASHTMNPYSGKPVDNVLSAVTIFANTCMAADALATALMVMGRDHALAFCEDHRLHALLTEGTGDETLSYLSTGLEQMIAG